MLEPSAVTAVLKTEEQVEGIRSFLRTHDRGNDVIAAPLCADLMMVIAHVVPSGVAEVLTRNDASPLGFDEPSLARLAFSNLRVEFDGLARLPMNNTPGIYLSQTRHASSTLMLADIFEGYAALCRGELLAVAPARDFLLTADSNHSGVLYELPVVAHRVQAQNPDPLSDLVLKWTPDGFLPF